MMSQSHTFDIEPNRGAGCVRIGAPRTEVRDALDAPYSEFRRTEKSVNTTDHYDALGVLVYYDQANTVEAIEFSSPADVRLGEQALLLMSCKDTTEYVTSLDPDVSLEADGFVSRKLGVSAYMPDATASEGESPESIVVFGPGYYD